MPPRGSRFPGISAHDPAQTEHGHIHRDEDYGDQKADQKDQGRFEQRPHALDPEFEFFGEHFALTAEHLRQAVGLFAHADQGRKLAVVQGGEFRYAGRESPCSNPRQMTPNDCR